MPALLNGRLQPVEVAQLIEQGEITGAVIMKDEAMVEAVTEALPKGAPLLRVGGPVGAAEDFGACRAGPESLPPIPQPEPDDLSFIFYTAGTTGLPKGVMISHLATLHRVIWISTQAGLRYGTHNRTLGLATLSHAIGFYGNFLVTLAYNGTFYVMSQFKPVTAVDAIDEHAITFLFTVPTIYHAIVNAQNYGPEKMATLDLVLYGGDAIAPQLLDRLDREWPATIRHIYGTTETMCSLYNPEPVGQAARLRPGFYSRVRVINYDGGPEDVVQPGEEGELIVDATVDIIFNGYLNQPDATAEKVHDGWYRTGDICILHGDSDVELMGRVDDMIRTGGESVHPEEVEAVLATHPEVREVSVIGVPDDHWGQMVVACVVGAEDGLTVKRLDQHCRESTLARYKRPRGYVFVESVPRNAANKVLRRLLRDLVGDAREAKGDVSFHSID